MTRSDVGPAKVALADTGPEAVSSCLASSFNASLLVLYVRGWNCCNCLCLRLFCLVRSDWGASTGQQKAVVCTALGTELGALATHHPSQTNAGACLQGPAAAAPPPPKKDDDAEDDSKFDEFMGADTALLAGTTGEYDKDDKEADEIWAHVDDFMDDRRRVRVCWHSGLSFA